MDKRLLFNVSDKSHFNYAPCKHIVFSDAIGWCVDPAGARNKCSNTMLGLYTRILGSLMGNY
jgi:hypothetical protein